MLEVYLGTLHKFGTIETEDNMMILSVNHDISIVKCEIGVVSYDKITNERNHTFYKIVLSDEQTQLFEKYLRYIQEEKSKGS